jgi:type II secretory pathway component PulK
MGSFTVSYDFKEGDFGSTRFGIRDENSKININKADIKVLSRLLEIAAGLNDQRALSLAHAIMDWRDKDSFFQHPQYGAEDSDYKNLDEPYEAKDSDFEVKEELLMVIGMDPGIFEDIEDLVTVYGEGKVNINTAPQNVLLALGLNDSLVQKILLFRKGEDMIAGTFDDYVFTSTATVISEISKEEGVSSSDISELSRFIESEIFVTTSSDFMIKCTSRLKTKNDTAQITAVASKEGLIRYWREDY